MYSEIDNCRICHNTNLLNVLSLGEQALTGVFPHHISDYSIKRSSGPGMVHQMWIAPIKTILQLR